MTKLGFDENGINKVTGTKYDEYGYDLDGYDALGYDRNGYDKKGYDRNGYDKDGYSSNDFLGNKEEYSSDGYNLRGIYDFGFEKNGYDVDGYDKNGYDKNGYDKHGKTKDEFCELGFTSDYDYYENKRISYLSKTKQTKITQLISYFLGDNSFVGYAGDVYRFGSLFGIESMNRSNVHNIDDYIFDNGKVNWNKSLYKYKYIILDLPYGLKGPLQEKKINVLLDFIEYLDDDGSLFVGLEPRIIELLQKKGCYIAGVIEGEKGDLPMAGVVPYIVIIKKKKFDDLFLVSTSDVKDVKNIYDNFVNHVSGEDLSDGVFIKSVYNFSVFNTYRSNKRIENLDTQYKEVDRYELGQLCDISIIPMSQDLDDSGEYIYVPKIGTMNVVGSLDEMDKKPHNYLRLKVTSDLVTREYLLNYFKTEIAQISLQGCLAGAVIQSISKTALSTLKIPVLKRDVQEKLNDAYIKLQNMRNTIDDIEKRLSVTPWNIDDILSDLNDKKLAVISEGDKLRDLIIQGESLTLEFKQTFFVDTRKKTEEQYIRKESLKNIAGFMNKEGGTLLIGVCDDQTIYGIENDNFKSDDEYLKRFKDIVKTSFEPPVLNNISFRIVKIEGKKVLRVDCPKSEKLIYLKDERDGAYVRTNPAVEKLTGQDLIDYSELRKRQ